MQAATRTTVENGERADTKAIVYGDSPNCDSVEELGALDGLMRHAACNERDEVSMKAGLLAMGLVAAMSSSCAARRPPSLVEQHGEVTLSDGEFAHLMGTHHRAVMDVALLAAGRAKSPEIKALATTIWEARRRELTELDALKGLAPRLSQTVSSHERELIAEHRASMTRLKDAKPAALEKLFVDEMLRRNQMGFEMIAQARLDDVRFKQLAERLADAQRIELKELKELQRPTSTRNQ